MEWIGCVRCEKSWHDFLAPCFSSSFMQLRNDPKCIPTLCNAPKHEFRVQWSGPRVRLRKILTWLRGTNFCMNCTSWPCFASSFIQLWNDPKCTQTLCNAPKHEFMVQWGWLGAFVAKIPMWLHGTNFCINCTSSPRFASSFMQLQHDNKCTQTLCNTPKHEFRVQWSGLGVLVEKNPDVTLRHVLLH